MKHGFLKVAAITPKIKVADPAYNAEQIRLGIDEAKQKGAKIVSFPELCLTGYTCADLLQQPLLLEAAANQLAALTEYTNDLDALVFVGLPYAHGNKIYNVAAALNRGRVLALIPKSYIPNSGEFYEARYFAKGNQVPVFVNFMGQEIPLGTQILFATDAMTQLTVAAEICEDVWAAHSPGTSHAIAGANMIVNLSASNELVGKAEYRKTLLKATSARLICAYLYCSAGEGESTQDVVFSGHNMIAENGILLAEAERFANQSIYADVDIEKLTTERRTSTSYKANRDDGYVKIKFELAEGETVLERKFEMAPFVPADEHIKSERCKEILFIQAYGLKKRMEHTNGKTAVIGVSGGLDSTLALLVTAKTFDLLGKDRKQIYAVTMPCFGTTDRTYQNACKLAQVLGANLMEIDIKDSVCQHFRDIGHDMEHHDVTYENGQARERTQVLMDIANQKQGMVIGTGDLSELVLGWATYNGDHMSMYGVNGGVPKTLVRHLVGYYKDTCEEKELTEVLSDILDTPVSPELLPPTEGKISQKTEELVGPYELHDFFLYYVLRFGFPPDKIYRIAITTFQGIYEKEVILTWLKVFYQRFFSQQFKRSCLPDGPKVGSVAVSPRGDLRMPSDASAALWLAKLEEL